MTWAETGYTVPTHLWGGMAWTALAKLPTACHAPCMTRLLGALV